MKFKENSLRELKHQILKWKRKRENKIFNQKMFKKRVVRKRKKLRLCQIRVSNEILNELKLMPIPQRLQLIPK